MQYQEKLEQMKERIREDCRFFGVGESYCNDILRTDFSDNDYYFYYDPDKGYVLTFWERGFCNWGMNSTDELGFRFLFQRHIVLHDFMFLSIPDAKKSMKGAYALFGATQEYGDAEVLLNRKKEAAARDGE